MGIRLRRLLPAADVARKREEAAAAELARLRDQLTRHEARLLQLNGFRAEYARQFESDGQVGLPVRRLQDFVRFISNLDERIGQAQKESKSLREHVDAQSRTWTAARAKHQALVKLLRRCRTVDRELEEKREQAASDEWAIRGSAQAKVLPD